MAKVKMKKTIDRADNTSIKKPIVKEISAKFKQQEPTETEYIDNILNQNKKLDFVQRMFQKNTPSIQIEGQEGRSTHFMESSDGRVYPTVVKMPDGKLKYLNENDKDAAWNYAKKTKQYIQFPSDMAAQWFAENYKKGTNVLKNK